MNPTAYIRELVIQEIGSLTLQNLEKQAQILALSAEAKKTKEDSEKAKPAPEAS